MQDFSVMQCFQASDNLNENIPNLLFLDVGFSLLVAANLLEDITIVSIFHYETIGKVIITSIEMYYTYHRLLLGSSMKASLYAITPL